MKCPVCHDVQVDPCTLSCGHTTCQLCLARMWDTGHQSCPVCKTLWQVFPSISIEYRYVIRSISSLRNIISNYVPFYREQIETLYSELVIQRRQRYSQTEKDLIKRFLSAKEESTQELSSGVQKLRDNIASTKGSEQEWSNPTFPFFNRAIKSVVFTLNGYFLEAYDTYLTTMEC